MLSVLIATFSCKNESFYEGSNAAIRFSQDTLTFDTVFTSIGSATQILQIYNPYNQSIKISSIYLAGGNSSPFIININGINTNSLSDLTLAPKDSLYIFIQFFKQSNGINTPLLLKDSLQFIINNHRQQIFLEAYSQDIHLLNNQILKTQLLPNDKPYLVEGNLTVDSLSTVTIAAGATFYFHRNANFVVKGTLIANGSLQNQILFASDRLEKEYQNVQGQWGGIGLFAGSNSNVLNYAIIENGTSGILIGGYDQSVPVDLTLSNTIVQCMSYNCLLAYDAQINANNCVFADAFSYTCGLLGGGSYSFYQCTLANYYSINGLPALYTSDYDANGIVNSKLVQVNFYNSIIYGNNDSDQLIIDYKGINSTPPYFENCLLLDTDISNCRQIFQIVRGIKILPSLMHKI